MDPTAIQDLAVQALNISLMLSLGLELRGSQLREAATQTRLLGLVVLLNLGVIPLLAVGANHLVPMAEAVTAGVFLSAFAPGGGTGTLLTRLSGGNLALSVISLAILTVLAVPLTPTLTTLCLRSGAEMSLDPFALLETLVIFQLVPFTAGAGLRAWRAPAAEGLNRLARPASNVIFAALVVGLLITQGHLVADVGWEGIGVITLLVVVSLALPAALPIPAPDRAAISLTTAVRNISLALLLSTTFFSPMTTLTVLTYGLIMYLVGVPWAVVSRRRAAVAQSLATMR